MRVGDIKVGGTFTLYGNLYVLLGINETKVYAFNMGKITVLHPNDKVTGIGAGNRAHPIHVIDGVEYMRFALFAATYIIELSNPPVFVTDEQLVRKVTDTAKFKNDLGLN